MRDAGKSRNEIAAYCHEQGTTYRDAFSLVDVALTYAQLGWLVIPTVGKVPCGGKAWQKKATADPVEVARHFSTTHDGLGVVLGQRSRIIDIECDDPAAEQTLSDLFEGNIPLTPTFQSTRGKHRVFCWREDLPGPNVTVAKIGKLEIRTGNGNRGCQTVFPPSGNRKWILHPSDVPVAEIPSDVVEKLRSRAETPKSNPIGSACRIARKSPAATALKRARAWIAKAESAVSGQGGHDKTFYTAVKLVSFGLNRDEVFELLSSWNQSCQPPWSDGELWHKIDDAIASNPEPIKDRRAADCSDSSEDEGEDKPAVRNFEMIEVQTEDGLQSEASPLSITEVERDIKDLTGDWPRNVGGQLFIPRSGGRGISWLPDADALFAYLGYATNRPPIIKSGAGFHPKREIFSHLQRQTTSYVAVEELPHEPPIANHFYACPAVASGTGDTLRNLVNRFSPETEIDRDLIWAAFVTPFLGSDGGTRPAFCITAPDRGAGKSKLVKFIAQLAGGLLDISSNEDIATLKTRLLSTEATAKRIVLFDNIKTSKLSWAELEALITSSTVSGKRMYVGEWQRPNTFTYFLTMNGASFSRDMAQRCVVIKLRMPDYSGDWEAETQEFIETNRESLISDVVGFLRTQPSDLKRISRWGIWDRAVVARLPEPNEAQAVILERQCGVDVDREESEVIEDCFASRLAHLGYDVANDRVFIPSSIACRWLGWALNDRLTSTKSTQMLNQRIEDQSFTRLVKCRNRVVGRGFEFWGLNTTGQTYLQKDLEEQIRIKGDSQYAG